VVKGDIMKEKTKEPGFDTQPQQDNKIMAKRFFQNWFELYLAVLLPGKRILSNERVDYH
jgi:hypothetical protein